MWRNIDRNTHFILMFLLARFSNTAVYALITCYIKRRLLKTGKYNEKGVNLFCIWFYKAKPKIKRAGESCSFRILCVSHFLSIKSDLLHHSAIHFSRVSMAQVETLLTIRVCQASLIAEF